MDLDDKEITSQQLPPWPVEVYSVFFPFFPSFYGRSDMIIIFLGGHSFNLSHALLPCRVFPNVTPGR